MAFAQISGARLPLCSPRIRGVVFTTLQDSNNATDRLLARPQEGLCRGASTLRISPRAGHQLHSCLVTTVAGLPPASQIRFPGRTRSQTTSASARSPDSSHPQAVGRKASQDDPSPSLRPHYRAVIATTVRSAPVPRITTLPLADLLLGVLAPDDQPQATTAPLAVVPSGRQVPEFRTRAQITLAPPFMPDTHLASQQAPARLVPGQ
jgi:hypothetical protein